MKKEYDFSKGERGKFYRPDAKFSLPIYLNPEAYSFVERVAQKKDEDVSAVASGLIMTDKQIADMVQ